MDSIKRKEPIGMGKAVQEFIRELKLENGVNTQRVLSVWDEVSGAAAYTSDKYFKDGVLYVTVRSSVVRNNLYFQLAALIIAMNDRLSKDSLVVRDAPGWKGVTKIILR